MEPERLERYPLHLRAAKLSFLKRSPGIYYLFGFIRSMNSSISETHVSLCSTAEALHPSLESLCFCQKALKILAMSDLHSVIGVSVNQKTFCINLGKH